MPGKTVSYASEGTPETDGAIQQEETDEDADSDRMLFFRELFDSLEADTKELYWALYEPQMDQELTQQQKDELLTYVREGLSDWNPGMDSSAAAVQQFSESTEVFTLRMQSTGAYQGISGMYTLGNQVNLATLGRNGKDVWLVSLDSEPAFCLDMVLKAHSGNTYTRTGETSDETIRRAVAYYELTNHTPEGYEYAQMYIWSNGNESTFVRTMFEYALSKHDNSLYTAQKLLSMEISEMHQALNQIDAGYATALGRAYNALRNQNTDALSSVYVFSGPAGYQRFATLYQGVWKIEGETPPAEPEYPQPQYSSVSASSETKVTYQVSVRKTDDETGMGLEGAEFDVYRDGSKVGTIKTDGQGIAVWNENETLRASSGEMRYCTNFDELSSEDQAQAEGFHSEAQARAAAQAEADQKLADAVSRAGHTYELKETHARDGYYLDPSQSCLVFTVAAGESKSKGLTNSRTQGKICLKKTDAESGKSLPQGEAILDGAIYDLYVGDEDILHPDGKSGVAVYRGTVYENGQWVEKDIELRAGTLAASAQVKDGEISFEGLYLGDYVIQERIKETVTVTGRDLYGYEIQEIRCLSWAQGYLVDPEEHPIALSYNGQEYAGEIVTWIGDTRSYGQKNHTVCIDQCVSREQVVKSSFRLEKLGAGTGDSKPGVLEGAGFQVFCIGKLSKAGEFSKKTDGSYDLESVLAAYVNEYYTDTALKYDFSDETQAAIVVYADREYADAYNASLLSGQNGTGAGLIPTGNAGEYKLSELYTNAAGALQSPLLPYGQYLVVETSVPDNHFAVEPFLVIVDEMSPTEIHQPICYLLDEEFDAYLKVTKFDSDTGRSVCKPGTSYRIYDIENDCYVKQMDFSGADTTKTDIFMAGPEGVLLLAERLPVGEYRLEEVTAPEGFYNRFLTEGQGSVTFTIGTGRTYQATGEKTGEGRDIIVIEETYENAETRGRLTLQKTGEVLTDYEDGQFLYEEKPLSGAVFEIRAAGDIETQDGQKDAYGNPCLWYQDGELVAVVTTGETGGIVHAEAGGQTALYTEKTEEGDLAVLLPLGSYTVTEILAPYGYLGSPEPITVTFQWEGQTEKIVYRQTEAKEGTLVCKNIREKADRQEQSGLLGIGVRKQAVLDGSPLAGACFALYTQDAIYDFEGRLLLEAGSLLAVSEPTDEAGFTGFDVDIPIQSEEWENSSSGNSGRYFIRELKSPEGYLQNTDDIHVIFREGGTKEEWITVSAFCEDRQTEFYVSKQEIGGSKEIPGCLLTILRVTGKDAKNGYEAEEVLRFVSKDTPTKITGLCISEEGEEILYILRELRPADGYVTAEDMVFWLRQARDEEGTLLQETEVICISSDGNLPVEGGQLVMKDDKMPETIPDKPDEPYKPDEPAKTTGGGEETGDRQATAIAIWTAAAFMAAGILMGIELRIKKRNKSK